MEVQFWFNLYTYVVVGVFAQSILAWELGYKGVARLLKGGPSGSVIAAFLLFGVQVLWQRLADLESPFTSLRDGWPVLVAIAVFVIARTRRPVGAGSHNQRFAEIQQRLVKTASDQSFQLKVIKEEEAASIARLCDFSNKPHDPAAFVDVALMLLCYPSELGFVIALEFSNFAHQVGFQPFGTIMVAVGHIDSLYPPMFVRKSLLDQRPELDQMLSSKEQRIQRAAKLLATGLFVSSKNLDDARVMYRSMSADTPVKQRVVHELRKYDPNLAREIGQ